VLGVQSIGYDAEMEDNKDDGGCGEEWREEEKRARWNWRRRTGGGEEGGGALAMVTIPGFNSSKQTFFPGNLTVGDFNLLLQVAKDGVCLINFGTLAFVAQWSPLDDSDGGGNDKEDEPMFFITIASANKSGKNIGGGGGGAGGGGWGWGGIPHQCTWLLSCCRRRRGQQFEEEQRNHIWGLGDHGGVACAVPADKGCVRS
jgi:hypothetical protein